MRTYLQSRAMAKSLRDSLAAKNLSLSHGECLEIVAQQFGFGNWNVLAAKIALESGEQPKRATGDVELHQLLPWLPADRILRTLGGEIVYLGLRPDAV